MFCRKRIFLVAPLLAISCAASAQNFYSFEQLLKGVDLNAAVAQERSLGNRVTSSDDGKTHYVQSESNRLVRTLTGCQGRLVAVAYESAGGTIGFIKRVAEYNREWGQGVGSAKSYMSTVGEVSTLEFMWREGARELTLSFTPGTEKISESQWLQFRVSSSCTR